MPSDDMPAFSHHLRASEYRCRTVTKCAKNVVLDVCCVDSLRDRKGAIIVSPHQGEKDGPTQPYPTPPPDGRGPHGALLPHRRCLRPSQPPARCYESIKRLSDSQVIALALFQQLRGVESERSLSWATPRGSSPTSCSPGW